MKYAMQRLMLVALVSLLPSMTWGAQTQPLIEKVKIGVAAPLTGLQAHYGHDFLNGIILATADFNASKAIINGKQIEIVLDTADDQANSHVATAVAKKLVDDDIKGVLGHFNSGTTIPASRIYAQAGIPQIAMATAAEYTQQGFRNTFRMMTSDTQQGKVAGHFVVRKLGIKRLALVDDRTIYGKGLAEQFGKAAKEAGVIIVGREFTTNKATNFTAMLIKLKRLKPDAIFYGGADAQAAPLVKQMYRLGLKAKLISGDMVKTSSFLEMAGTAAEGTVASLAGVPLNAMPQGQKFMQKYRAHFHEEAQTYAPYSYDGAMAMFAAMKKANSTDPDKYLSALTNINIAGVTTNRFAYDKYGNLKDVRITLYQVVQGKWQALSSMPNQ